MAAIKGISFDFLKCEFGFSFEKFLCSETYHLKTNILDAIILEKT